jgi:hypothetical protein
MRRNLRRHGRLRNCASAPCLFAWADTRAQSRSGRSLAVTYIQQRTRCTNSTARLYASLAGFPVDGGV